MRITFVSLNKDFIDIAHQDGFNTHLGKIQDYEPPEDSENIYYVSPANTLLFMDGGIDYAYSRIMFPGIENKIKETLKSLPHRTLLGRPYLPIGQTILTKTDIYSKSGNPCYLISSPTMLLPQDVSKTPNAFICMVAIMKLLKSLECNDNDELILTSFCCGYGKMKPIVSFEQIKKAMEYNSSIADIPTDPEKIIHIQPNYYANSEWKKINGCDIIKE